ncbi:MAG TPA: sigma-70 family RNA polymerase sigma factor [Terriglobales bacterium]
MDASLNPAGIATQALTRGLAHEEFDDLVREHQQRIFRVVMALVRDSELASNLTQDCFVRAYEKRASFRGDASVSTWLIRIAVNLVRDHVRNRRQSFWKKLFHRSADEDVASTIEHVRDGRSTIEHQLVAREELAAVWLAVSKLTHQQREVFTLRFSEEMSLEEIAAVLDVKLGTVKTHLSRAIAAVREQVRGTAS